MATDPFERQLLERAAAQPDTAKQGAVKLEDAPSNATEMPHEAAPRRRSLARILVPLLFLLLIAGAVGGGLWWKQEQERRWKWEAILMPEDTARVPESWPVAKLAERLQKTKKVRDAPTFLQAARQVGLTQVAPGGYTLPDKAGPLELAHVFKDGPDSQKVTFPEGWTAGQMAARLSANKFAGSAEFLRLAYPPGQLVSPLEGRLFPETYQLPLAGTGKQLAQRLQDRFNEVMAKLPRPFPRGAGTKPMTAAEVVILASLVERETSVPSERPIIAGVLLNRLRGNKMRLQCDASVQYALQRAAATISEAPAGHKNRLLLRDLKISSPFNTYQRDGLPPGPICNPGEAALRAAAAPAETPYLFYVMSPKLKRHRFSTTFAEHQRNISLARQERNG